MPRVYISPWSLALPAWAAAQKPASRFRPTTFPLWPNWTHLDTRSSVSRVSEMSRLPLGRSATERRCAVLNCKHLSNHAQAQPRNRSSRSWFAPFALSSSSWRPPPSRARTSASTPAPPASSHPPLAQRTPTARLGPAGIWAAASRVAATAAAQARPPFLPGCPLPLVFTMFAQNACASAAPP